jgi:hypothetical protein
MSELTRRYPERPDCCVYYDDVHAGTIAKRIGIPYNEDPWGWSCGFYPGCHPGECTNGAAPTFDQAGGVNSVRIDGTAVKGPPMRGRRGAPELSGLPACR